MNAGSPGADGSKGRDSDIHRWQALPKGVQFNLKKNTTKLTLNKLNKESLTDPFCIFSILLMKDHLLTLFHCGTLLLASNVCLLLNISSLLQEGCPRPGLGHHGTFPEDLAFSLPNGQQYLQLVQCPSTCQDICPKHRKCFCLVYNALSGP
jgi:hypothetical protein